jgi:hypothetical protein
VLGLVLLATAAVVFAARRARTMEIQYTTD